MAVRLFDDSKFDQNVLQMAPDLRLTFHLNSKNEHSCFIAAPFYNAKNEFLVAAGDTSVLSEYVRLHQEVTFLTQSGCQQGVALAKIIGRAQHLPFEERMHYLSLPFTRTDQLIIRFLVVELTDLELKDSFSSTYGT